MARQTTSFCFFRPLFLIFAITAASETSLDSLFFVGNLSAQEADSEFVLVGKASAKEADSEFVLVGKASAQEADSEFVLVGKASIASASPFVNGSPTVKINKNLFIVPPKTIPQPSVAASDSSTFSSNDFYSGYSFSSPRTFSDDYNYNQNSGYNYSYGYNFDYGFSGYDAAAAEALRFADQMKAQAEEIDRKIWEERAESMASKFY